MCVLVGYSACVGFTISPVPACRVHVQAWVGSQTARAHLCTHARIEASPVAGACVQRSVRQPASKHRVVCLQQVRDVVGAWVAEVGPRSVQRLHATCQARICTQQAIFWTRVSASDSTWSRLHEHEVLQSLPG